MRSKQLNFFILPEEWTIINDFLFLNDLQIITQPIFDRSSIFSTDMSLTKDGEFEKVYLTKNIFKEELIIEFIETQNYYLLNDICSYAIEFSRGGFYPNKPNELVGARFYFVTQYYQNDVLVRKNPAFIKWADNFLAMFKKKFLSTQISGYGISDKTLKWMNENGKSLSDSGLTIN